MGVYVAARLQRPRHAHFVDRRREQWGPTYRPGGWLPSDQRDGSASPHSYYKALWSTQDGSTASGFNSDLVAAIDQAVADGVDVINYSVGPSSPPDTFLAPEQVSFLFAADAGVFVSAAAGNAGPGPALLPIQDHGSPQPRLAHTIAMCLAR